MADLGVELSTSSTLTLSLPYVLAPPFTMGLIRGGVSSALIYDQMIVIEEFFTLNINEVDSECLYL